MPPKRKSTEVVRWLVQSRFTGGLKWLDEPLTPFLETQVYVLAYGLEDGTVKWGV